MFLFDILNRRKQSTPTFTKEPIISGLSRSFNDAHWPYPHHIHKQKTGLIYFPQGKISYQANNEIFHVSEDDLLVVNKSYTHSTTSNHESPISRWMCATTNFTIANVKAVDCFLPLGKKPYAHTGEHRRIITGIFEALEMLSQQKTQSSATICDTLANALARIYFHIFQNAATDRKRKKLTFAQNILFYIDENYASDITLEEPAEHFRISSDYISHKFKGTYGISPVNYMIDRRISEAKWMLINTSDSPISISSQVGYDSTTHFTKLFLEGVGYPPLGHRECFGMKTSNEEQKGCSLSSCGLLEKTLSQMEGNRIGKKIVYSVITPMVVDGAIAYKKASS